MALANLAAKTGLSASTLSRLETGRMRPTLEQLLPLARVHGVPLDEFSWVAPPPATPGSTSGPSVEAASRACRSPGAAAESRSSR